jgi:hypothetical protein
MKMEVGSVDDNDVCAKLSVFSLAEDCTTGCIPEQCTKSVETGRMTAQVNMVCIAHVDDLESEWNDYPGLASRRLVEQSDEEDEGPSDMMVLPSVGWRSIARAKAAGGGLSASMDSVDMYEACRMITEMWGGSGDKETTMRVEEQGRKPQHGHSQV